MSRTEQTCPEFPPGFWRRIVLHPGNGWIGAALEDEVHNFRLRMDHAEGRVSAVHATAIRHPWSACTGATTHIAQELEGALLEEVAKRDPLQQCTHLYDMAVLCAAHTGDTAPSQIDMLVGDRVEERTTGVLSLDGEEKMRWRLDGTTITGPEEFAGRDIKRVSKWKHEYTPEQAEWATMLRRTVFVSGVRQYESPDAGVATDMGSQRMGACYNYQMPQASTSTPVYQRRDFSVAGTEPLAGLDAEPEFAGK